MNTEKKVKSFLSRYMKVDNLKNEDNFFEKGLVNSLFAMQLVAFLEQEFELVIENEELNLKNFHSVNAIVNFVEKKIA